MRKKKYLFLFLAFSLIMVLVTVFGENGLLHVFRLKRDLGKLTETNQSLRRENTTLLEEIEYLKNHDGYLEFKAHEQGLVKDGEEIFQFDGDR
jgi:cell division protein FtsB